MTELNSWRNSELGSFVSLFGGAAFKSQDATREGIKWLKIANVGFGTVKWEVVEYLPEDFKEENERYLLKSPDIVVAMTRPILNGYLKVARLRPCDGIALLNQRVAKVVTSEKIDSEFVLQHLFTRRLASSLELALSGTDPPNLSSRVLDEVSIPIPPLPEQQKIAAILSTWDRAIELTEKLIAAKQKRKQALMQQLLTGKVRFKEFVKSKNRQKTPIGNMPSDWKTHRLGKIVEKVKRKNPDGEVHVLTASGEHGLVDQRDFFNRSVAGADLSGYYLLKRGEFAYNRSAMKGYPFGAIKRLDRYEQGVLSTLYICFGITDSRCDSDYLRQFFEACLLDKQLRGITQVGGRAHGLLNITDGDFYSMSVVLPSIPEQQKIAAVLDTQDSEINSVRKKLAVLNQQKKGLMQQLLTGNIRVKFGA
ncbi:restriction endonuclease subunit S [Rosistilla oblonga]|uniref:restriction endonuclease subunit S n=1 Tax=Rosistilla oblonga TaxID=2527990 RepID=UPI003A978209